MAVVGGQNWVWGTGANNPAVVAIRQRAAAAASAAQTNMRVERVAAEGARLHDFED